MAVTTHAKSGSSNGNQNLSDRLFSSGSLTRIRDPGSLEEDRKGSFSNQAQGASSYHNQRKMTNTVKASNKAAILAVGEELRLLLREEEPPLIKDRRYHLRVYQDCFAGHEMVDWLLKKGEVDSRKEAVAMMQKLLDHGVIHHVCDDHCFKDEKLFYRFRKDDGTYQEPANALVLAKGQRLYSRMRGDGSNLIRDRKYHLHSYSSCFVGQEFVDWLVKKGEAQNRKEAVEIGMQLVDAGVIRHVCDDHHFKDDYLFYRFKNDEGGKSPKLKDRLGSIGKKSSKKNREGQGKDEDTSSYGDSTSEHRVSGSSWGSDTATPARSTPEQEEYVNMKQASPLPPRTQPSPVPPRAPSPQRSTEPQTNGSISYNSNSTRRPTVEELMDSNGLYTKRKIDIVSDPVGYGFVIRGSRPVYVHTVDPSGPAAAAGLQVGEYLYSVNGEVVIHASHTDAARIILMGSSTASLVTFVEKDSFNS